MDLLASVRKRAKLFLSKADYPIESDVSSISRPGTGSRSISRSRSKPDPLKPQGSSVIVKRKQKKRVRILSKPTEVFLWSPSRSRSHSKYSSSNPRPYMRRHSPRSSDSDSYSSDDGRVKSIRNHGPGLRMATYGLGPDMDNDDDWDDFEVLMLSTGGDPDSLKKEATWQARLDNTKFSRRMPKIGSLARPGVTNLCYINATLQALAATRFPHFISRDRQCDDDMYLNAHDALSGVFEGVNQWYNDGFGGALYDRVKKGRLTLTPKPPDLDLDKYPFTDDGETPQCDVKEFLESLHEVLETEKEIEKQGFLSQGHDKDGWINHESPLVGEQTTKVACLRCGYTYMETEERTWIGGIMKPFTDGQDGPRITDLEDTLDHFTRVRLTEDKSCVACDLTDLHELYTRASATAQAACAKETGDGSTTAPANLAAINKRIAIINQALRHKARNETIPVDNRGAVTGLEMRGADARSKTYHSETKAISKLPNTLVLGYDIIDQVDYYTRKKNKMHLTIPPVLIIAPWTVDTSGSNFQRDPLLPLRPSDSTFMDGVEYVCRAIIYHQGDGTNSGHYFTDRLPWMSKDLGKDPHPPYEWWTCNEVVTDMFADDQPFPAPSAGKEQEAMVIYERILDPKDKPGVTPRASDTLDYYRKYRFSEVGLSADPVIFSKAPPKSSK
ncbi:hypothetical protein H072_6973 [Dactylellina haptotyla CBS 200.50]|uniref:ubiquitinyl hydrolase 1 n=1 Tax=Dactylellina haptotyla (strain CBS 200.50) TaxID=1284197 RepID=S8ADU2_DACHA|nr:hypothetical protein H072_6973 [Dactylellina haptotyla CBS 200.50]